MQMANPHLAYINTMKPRIPLHRGSIEADEFSAPECARFREANAAADAPDLYEPLQEAPRIPRKRQPTSWVGPMLGVLSLLAVAAALVWPS